MAGRGNEPRGPVRRRLRQRMMERTGLEVPVGLEAGSLDVGGEPRTYSLAPAAQPDAPLLLVLHGAGGTGLGMAALTGLHTRGPAAGFAVVFPDGSGGVWNDQRDAPRLKRREGIDDVAFLEALIARLVSDHVAAPSPVFAAGISNGALMSEHLARHGLIDLAGIALVAGAATVVSRQAVPSPARPTLVVAFAGTADPLVPYAGGPIGPLGRLVQQRGERQRASPGRGLAAPAEDVAADWAAANGCAPLPTVETEPAGADGLVVTKLIWHAPGRPSVVLYRVEGGGHTWPGGAQYLPPRIVGPVASNLDATGVILDAFRAETSR